MGDRRYRQPRTQSGPGIPRQASIATLLLVLLALSLAGAVPPLFADPSLLDGALLESGPGGDGDETPAAPLPGMATLAVSGARPVATPGAADRVSVAAALYWDAPARAPPASIRPA